MEGTSGNNGEWMRRKRNTTYAYEISSLYFETEDGAARLVSSGYNLSDYAPAGGAFPIIIKGGGVIGAVVVSGLTSVEDHNLAANAIASHLGIENCPQAEERT
jgi:uncharacterized protein (UPF0303 family)